VRQDLLDKCDLHTVLRLPTGIFYAQGVKTNVLFFTRGEKDKGNTKATWFFDMRANMPSFGKRTPFTREHFAEFEKAYGADPYGKSKRKDLGEAGRLRKFTREDVKARGDNLDISWLKDEGTTASDDLPEPEDIAADILALLQTATAEIEGLRKALGGEA
jgi:type I restriction enzyme M protein